MRTAFSFSSTVTVNGLHSRQQNQNLPAPAKCDCVSTLRWLAQRRETKKKRHLPYPPTLSGMTCLTNPSISDKVYCNVQYILDREVEMKKQERHCTIMNQMRQQEVQALATTAERGFVTSYDIARWQSVAQPHAWRLLNELLTEGFVKRENSVGENRMYVRWTLTPAGRKRLRSRPVALMRAKAVLLKYKIRRYRRGLA